MCMYVYVIYFLSIHLSPYVHFTISVYKDVTYTHLYLIIQSFIYLSSVYVLCVRMCVRTYVISLMYVYLNVPYHVSSFRSTHYKSSPTTATHRPVLSMTLISFFRTFYFRNFPYFLYFLYWTNLLSHCLIPQQKKIKENKHMIHFNVLSHSSIQWQNCCNPIQSHHLF